MGDKTMTEEQKRTYRREYARKRRLDPEFRKYHNALHKKWWVKNRDIYNKNRREEYRARNWGKLEQITQKIKYLQELNPEYKITIEDCDLCTPKQIEEECWCQIKNCKDWGKYHSHKPTKPKVPEKLPTLGSYELDPIIKEINEIINWIEEHEHKS